MTASREVSMQFCTATFVYLLRRLLDVVIVHSFSPMRRTVYSVKAEPEMSHEQHDRTGWNYHPQQCTTSNWRNRMLILSVRLDHHPFTIRIHCWELSMYMYTYIFQEIIGASGHHSLMVLIYGWKLLMYIYSSNYNNTLQLTSGKKDYPNQAIYIYIYI